MKKNKSPKDTSNTEGGQTINNNESVQKQFIIQNMYGNISDTQKAEKESEPVATSIDIIKKAITRAETDKAFKFLQPYLTKYHKDEMNGAILIESQWNHLKQDKINGVISDEYYRRERARIHQSLLSFIEML